MSGVQGHSPGTRADILSAIARGVDNRASPTRTADAKTANALGIGATVIGLTGISAALGYAYVSSEAEKAAAKKAAEEAAKKAEEDAAAKKAEEEAAAKKAEEAARKAAEEAAAKKAEEEAAAKKAAEEAVKKAEEDAAAAKKAVEDAKKAEEDAREAQRREEYERRRREQDRQKAMDQQTWKREAERIEAQQKAHRERMANGDKILDLEPVHVVPAQEHSTLDGILAYYAERTGLPSTSDPPDGPVYFVFERLCEATRGFWKKFEEHQTNATARMDGHPLKTSSVSGSLKETIELHEKRCGDTYDMWVAYVTAKTPIPIADREKLIPVVNDENQETTKIEMAMTVLVDQTAPVTSHVGTFRPYPYWEFDKTKQKDTSIGHKSISILLYAFAAAAALSLYKHLREDGVMVARLAGQMGKTLRQAMGQEVLVGSQGERLAKYVERRADRAKRPKVYENEDFSNDIYNPPLLQEGPDHKGPGFVGFVDGKRMFGEKEHQRPDWMTGGTCGHTDFKIRVNAAGRLEHTVLLSKLAQKWSASDTVFGRTRGARRRIRRRVPRYI